MLYLIHFEAALRDDLLKRNSAFRVLVEVLPRCGNGLNVIVGEVVILVDHDF